MTIEDLAIEVHVRQGDVAVRSIKDTLKGGRASIVPVTHGHDPDVLERELELDRR